MPRSIYVASSWRNPHQPHVVAALREAGHEVYDFRNPPSGTGFRWSAIDPNWQNWTPQQYREALHHPIAIAGHKSDLDAMKAADTCVLVLPSGRSASYEFGWCVGQGKMGIVYMPEACEPELMYRPAPITVDLSELLEAVTQPTPREIEKQAIEEGKRKVRAALANGCGACFKCLDHPELGFMNPTRFRMVLCATCGNKRCPKATDHTLACTGSNDPGQKGSRWEGVAR